jgi:hypothetical protein
MMSIAFGKNENSGRGGNMYKERNEENTKVSSNLAIVASGKQSQHKRQMSSQV